MSEQTDGGVLQRVGQAQEGSAFETSLPFCQEIAQGKVFLTLTDHPLPSGIVMERLVLEVPAPPLALGVWSQAERFRHQRLILQTLQASLPAQGILEWALSKRDPAEVGLSDLFLHLDAHGGILEGVWTVQGASAPFCLHWVATPLEDGRLSIALTDARVFGWMPLPAQALVPALASLIANPRMELKDGVFLELQPTRELLFRWLPRHGWKLPSLSQVRFHQLALQEGRVRFRLDSSAPLSSHQLVPSAGMANGALAWRLREEELRCFREGVVDYREADRLLLSGKHGEARALYQRSRGGGPLPPYALERLLQLELLESGGLESVEGKLRQLLQRDPQYLPGWLMLASLEEKLGREAAPSTWERVADLCLARGERPDGRLALRKAGAYHRASAISENHPDLELALPDRRAPRQRLPGASRFPARDAPSGTWRPGNLDLADDPAGWQDEGLASDLAPSPPRPARLAVDPVQESLAVGQLFVQKDDLEGLGAFLESRPAEVQKHPALIAWIERAIERPGALSGEPRQTIAGLRLLRRVNPALPQVTFRLANLLQHGGREEEAEALWRELDEQPAALSAEQRGQLDRALMAADFARGQKSEAEARCLRCLARLPGDRIARAWLERLRSGGQQAAETVSALLEAARVSRDPAGRFESYFEAGALMADELGNPKVAVVLYERAAALCPEEVRANRKLVEIYRHLDRPKRQWETLLSLGERSDGEEATASLRRAARLAEGALKEPAAARELWERIHARAPAELEALDRLIALERTAGLVDPLSEHLGERVELTPDPLLKLPWLKERARLFLGPLQRPEAALAVLRLVLSISPEDGEAMEGLSLALPVQQRPRDRLAAPWPRLALPSWEPARVAAAVTGVEQQRHLGELDAALQAILAVIEQQPEVPAAPASLPPPPEPGTQRKRESYGF